MQKDKQERYLELLAGLRLMDDDFFSEALDEKIAPVEYILNTVLERDDIRVLRTEAQVEYKSAANRSIKLDIRAVDAEGRVMDIEVQRADRGAGVRRARFHSSMLDRTLLDKGKDFEDLVDTYVIFITEHDRFGAGLPLYHVESDLNHPVGRLMHDMNCTNAADILNPLLAQEVRYLKETEGGRTQMCRAFEEIAFESAKEATHKANVAVAQKMLADGGLTLEQIAKFSSLPLSEVQELADKMPA